jgi:hypothetical protein
VTHTVRRAIAAAIVISVASAHALQPVARWSFETIGDSAPWEPAGAIHGKPVPAPGVEDKSLRFDGVRDYVSTPDATELSFTDATFSVTAWVNVYALNRGQQMIVAKNVYAANQREWGLMVDHDNHVRFYLQHEGWKTVGSKTVPTPGKWYHLAVTIDAGHGRLYVDGKLEGEGMLGPSVPDTAAPVTIGGVNNNGRLMQMLRGAVDEIQLFDSVLKPEEIRTMADRETTPHDVPKLPAPYLLWSGGDLPKSAEIPLIEGVRFSTIKPHQPEVDGGHWLLGVALAWHRGRLYASYGANPSPHENTATEEAHCRVSDDDGRTWGEVVVMDAGEGNLGVSHGVFLPHAGRLWAFQGAFYDSFQRTHTRAYLLDDETGRWEAKGVVVGDGFWPMQEPLKMADGNWIMSGARVDKGYPFKGNYPAVAISHGDDFTRWDLVVITPQAGVESVWGESTVFLAGDRITNVSRWGGEARALLAVSEDCGRTWTESMPTNLAMNTSKPYTGTLSTGEHYLVGATTADVGGRRDIVTIALTRPGETTFSRVFAIRHAVCPEGRGASNPKASLSYPYAVEQDGKLYVGYADKNRPSAELAVIPVSSLASADSEKPAAN